ncbi:MAG: hypothetical protein WC763_01920 [Candidatus Paceibacterota bacterium]|jgi:hypothetical protein
MLDNYFKQAASLGKTADRSAAWLEAHKEISDDIRRALNGSHELLFAIPIFGGTGEEFTTIHPWHHVFFEAEQDINSGILLLLTGFYKDSFRSIRSFIELQVFALYHFVNEDRDNFKNWLDGKANTPTISEMLKALPAKNIEFKTLNDKLQWNIEIQSLYKELSGFMHTQGATHTHTALRNSNVTEFSEVGLKVGLDFLLKALRLTAMGFVVNFPMSFHPLPLFDKFAFGFPAGGFLEKDQVDRIKDIFTNNTYEVLSTICLANSHANSLTEGIMSMPDLTEREVLQSLERTLESEEFANIRKEIRTMIKDGEFSKAVAYIQATQRAMMRTMTMVLYNPFYESSGRK